MGIVENLEVKKTFLYLPSVVFIILFLFFSQIPGEGDDEFHLSENGIGLPAWIAWDQVVALDNTDFELIHLSGPEKNSLENFWQKLLDYFRVESLSDLVTAHGVNNQRLLRYALTSSAHIIEFDITGDQVKHDEEDPSNLSIGETLRKIEDSGRLAEVDIKYHRSGDLAEAVDAVLQALEDEHIDSAIIINTDVLKGPDGGEALSEEELKYFFGKLEHYPNAVISLGWTSGVGGSKIYTPSMIEQMSDLVDLYQLADQPLSFAVNWKYLDGSEDEILRLMDRYPDAVLKLFFQGSRKQYLELMQILEQPAFADVNIRIDGQVVGD